ncbi:LacI family DNA-binding transcriptional regulator [Sinorhizobium meliloti]|uniref:LacI family DNA-binding transcriptional regulator n=1 Tax=Rhizobium meliloti TaxID=382 RepID=UPI00037FC94B|nr:LacI family DNA-binding transcriptional regulator [Sinorhizobium meliloti]
MATVRDIADIVGASPAAVSRVLSGDPTFKTSPELRGAIVATAKKLGYVSPRMRASAKTPESKSYKSIAIASRGQGGSVLNDGHMSMIRLGIERRSAELRFTIVDLSIEDLNDRRLSSRIFGSVIIGGIADDEADRAASLMLPIVIADWQQNDDRFDCVYASISRSVRAAIDSLKIKGHRDVRYVGPNATDLENRRSSGQLRFRAYLEAFGKRTSPLRGEPSGHPTSRSPFEVGYTLVADMIASGARPDALVVEDDDFAVGAYRALREAGLSPAADVAILSLCRTSLGAFQTPPLVSIDGRGLEIGRTAVDMLVSRVAGRTITRDVALPSEMLMRAR